MDSITHIALGAIVGEAIAGKTLGKRAMFLGAVAQSVPDIDFIAAFWLPAADNLLAHRGFTHSLLFGVLATLILAVFSERWHRSRKIPYTTWLLLFGAEIFIHLALDACNAYGVGWFEPFDPQTHIISYLICGPILFFCGRSFFLNMEWHCAGSINDPGLEGYAADLIHQNCFFNSQKACNSIYKDKDGSNYIVEMKQADATRVFRFSKEGKPVFD